jgi:hypothetical protein
MNWKAIMKAAVKVFRRSDDPKPEVLSKTYTDVHALTGTGSVLKVSRDGVTRFIDFSKGSGVSIKIGDWSDDES